MKIKFTYFKDTGKYYGEGDEEVAGDYPAYTGFELARRMVREGNLPGLASTSWDGTILVEIEGLPRIIQGHAGANRFLKEE